MANSRELSQFGRLVEIKDGSHIGIGTQSDVAIGFGTITAIQIGDSNTVYYGDGSNLSGVSASGGAGSIGIQSAGNLVGTATTINFGSGVTITDNVASVSVGSTTRFVGARLYHDNYSTSTANLWQEVRNWDGTAIDTDSFVDSSHGFTIPDGVSKVRLTMGAKPSSNTFNQWTIRKNGGTLEVNDGGIFVEAETNIGYSNGSVTGTTAVLSVSPGDTFDLRHYVNTTSNITWDIFFEIEVIEGNILGTYFSATNIVDDPTPQLGGNLDLNSNDINGTGNIDITGDIIATGSVGIGSTVVGVTTATGSLIYVPEQGIQVWTGSVWRTIESTSAISYSVTQDQISRNEGETVTFSVNTTGLSNGYELYWTTKIVSGTINASDFSDNATQGTATVNSSGQATITRTLSSDQSTEGTESFTIEIRNGGFTSAVVAEGQTVTIADTSTAVTYSGIVQGAYTSSSINGLSWSASVPNDGGAVSSIAIPTNRKTYIEIYWSSNGGGNPGAGVHSGQNTELGLGSNKVWWRGGSQNGLEENGLGSWTALTTNRSFSTGDYIGISMDNTANSGQGRITFYRNGTAIFEGGSGWTSRTNLYFHWQNNGNGTSAGTFNFGATSFQYPIAGYGGLYS